MSPLAVWAIVFVLAAAAALLMWFAASSFRDGGAGETAAPTASAPTSQQEETKPAETEAAEAPEPEATEAPETTSEPSPTPALPSDEPVTVEDVTIKYDGKTASGGRLYMYNLSSRLKVEVDISADGEVPAGDILWESSDEKVVQVIPASDGLSCELVKRGDGECEVRVSVGELSDGVRVISTAEAGVEAVNEDNLFESLPDYFYYSSNAGGWWTVLYIEDDGSFTGTYIDADTGYTPYDGFEDVPIYYFTNYYRYCSFSGKMEVVGQTASREFKLRIKEIRYENEPFSWEDFVLENGEHEVYMYTEPKGLTESKELTLYLPGRATEDLDGEFITWIMWDTNDFELGDELKYWGLYAANDGAAFVGMNGTFHG